MNTHISFEDTSIAFKAKSDSALRKTYLLFLAMNYNFFVRIGTELIKLAFLLKLPIKGIVRATMFGQFCGGETIGDCAPVIDRLSSFGIGTILDYSVEGEKSEEGFGRTASEVLKAIEAASRNKNIPFSVFKVSGIGSAYLLEKVQKKEQLSDKETMALAAIKARVDLLCKAAFEKKVKLLIDAEETWIQDPIDEIAYDMMKKYNKEHAIVFNTFQMYRKDMLDNLRAAYENAISGEYFLGVKLVRGAYMEKEREMALKRRYKDPIQVNKAATDRDFDEALKFSIDRLNKIFLVAGTHNEASNYLLVSLMKRKNVPKNHHGLFFVQLYGMSDHISYNLANAGYNVAKYVPYGPVEKVMPYLFRRANENTSIKGQSSREFKLIEKEVKRRRNKG